MKRFATYAVIAAFSSLPTMAKDSYKYSVAGTNLDGSSYSGTAIVTIESETTCSIRWQTGSTTSVGICMRSGDSYAAAYQLGGKVGLVIYKAEGGGSLKGIWTVTGLNGVGTEVLTPAN